ncbi:capsular biosynthesis protein [Clostridium sp. P21]|uniref:Capsular biosynthesis protein n=1 Tax=Clostridium muellerianum TaxID=2716538 RepID=A0A7Y0ECT5_9CLOT|nr:capsular biosynthesis protein [Clostridium muellerianum]NMM61121.1 capsular biosynthesis protein [Clostridium muellerianum]
MNPKSHFKDKLSQVLFLEIKKENIKRLFNTEVNEDIYIPVKSSSIVNQVKTEKNVGKIPISFFIEGMFYVIGADEKFRFNDIYNNILINIEDSDKFIKGKIAENIKHKNYEDAYILLKGLSKTENNIEIYDKLLIVVDELRKLDKSYEDEELSLIEIVKKNKNYPMAYFYEAIIMREQGDFEKALFCINNYTENGGKESLEVTEFKESLKLIINYEKGKEILYDSPKEALSLLLPLVNEFGNDAILYYHIAVAYRILENYEKAIYYLNESMSIDSNIMEVINEFGINYASLGDYETAIAYLRRAFEATKSIEICTNLIMCYLNNNDIKNAKLHLEIAKKINPEDDVVVELDGIIK